MSHKIPYYIIAVLLLVIWLQNSCEKDCPECITKTITIPEKTGTFKPAKPDHTPTKWPDQKPVIKWKDKIVEIENPINLIVFDNYLKAKDSMERLAILVKAIEIKDYSKTFEDSLITILNTGQVQGEVLWIKPTYTIKAQKVEIETPAIKETVFKMLASAEFGNTLKFDGFLAKGNLEFENKKGNSILAGYDTEQRIWLGYKVKLFEIKRNKKIE